MNFPFAEDGTLCSFCGEPLAGQQVVIDGELAVDEVFCDQSCLRGWLEAQAVEEAAHFSSLPGVCLDGSVRDFVRAAKAGMSGAADACVYLRDARLAEELGGVYSPNCGAYVRGVPDGFDCAALTGPDELGNWTGLCLDGIVRQWTKDEIV